MVDEIGVSWVKGGGGGGGGALQCPLSTYRKKWRSQDPNCKLIGPTLIPGHGHILQLFLLLCRQDLEAGGFLYLACGHRRTEEGDGAYASKI